MLRKIKFVCIGAFFIGVGVNGFILPLHLINGGVIGLSILLKYILGVPLSLSIILINLPFYLYSLVYEKTYFINGLLGVLISALIIEGLKPVNGIFHLPIFWGALSGGLFIGAGIGIMMRQHVSHGAGDLIALLISKHLVVNPGIVLLLIDLAIIILGIAVLRDKTLIYSLLTVGCVGLVSGLLTSIQSIHFFVDNNNKCDPR